MDRKNKKEADGKSKKSKRKDMNMNKSPIGREKHRAFINFMPGNPE
ncbi:MAG: hypothetical protein GX754_05375 [Clostridiaceae bacterium]|nr:hypothetical protein [Clostridiaceae bacterium]